MFIIVTYASCLICRLFSKDGPNFQVGGDVSQLKPQEDDATKSAANGIFLHLLSACWSFS